MNKSTNNFKRNKKSQLGSELILWIFRFIFLIMVSMGIVMIVGALYTQSLDIRKIEALALERKLADCISTNGFLNQAVLNDKDKFLENCNIVLNDEFYANVTVYDSSNKVIFNFKYGENLEPLCKTTSKIKYKPGCLETSLSVANNSINREQLTTNILVGIKKFDKNLK